MTCVTLSDVRLPSQSSGSIAIAGGAVDSSMFFFEFVCFFLMLYPLYGHFERKFGGSDLTPDMMGPKPRGHKWQKTGQFGYKLYEGFPGACVEVVRT